MARGEGHGIDLKELLALAAPGSSRAEFVWTSKLGIAVALFLLAAGMHLVIGARGSSAFESLVPGFFR